MSHRDPENQIFNNLYDQYKHLGLPLHLIKHTDFTVFNLKDVNQPSPFKSPLSRLNFFVFAFIKGGDGDYTIDEQTYTLQPGAIYFTNPGHFRSFNWRRIEDVYLFTLSESFLKENVHANIFDEFPFLLAETFPARVLVPEIFAEFETLYLQIQKEYDSESPYRYRIIGNLFVVMLLKFKEYIWKDYNPIYEGNRSSEIVKNFKRLLERHYRDLNSGTAEQVFRVQDYADAQNLHPNYLSNVIKIKTGKTISIWIAEKTIAEAKALLQNSQASIKEIAFKLGFNEATHFSNYFKKNAGVSPVLFRKEHAGMV
ncbi:AraC family transcriptional regulator [Mucilaginibacter sp. CAU 1740]|uniref:helix-turn-helix domain-containing protein n=1 Tax=Mucilaginibacter sp. CAU 1740 TaxID=3140365 RepID=UPI00325BFEF2